MATPKDSSARAVLADDSTLMFRCPGCGYAHGVRVNAARDGSGGCWSWNGDHDRPTLAPSVLVNAGRANPGHEVCHSFVREGRIEFLADCTHELAGRTVDLPVWSKR